MIEQKLSDDADMKRFDRHNVMPNHYINNRNTLLDLTNASTKIDNKN